MAEYDPEQAVERIGGLVGAAAQKAAVALVGMLNTELKRAVNGLPDGPSYRGIREDAAHIEFRSRVASASEVGGGESVVIEPIATGPLSRPMDQVLGVLEYGSAAERTPTTRFFSGVLAKVNSQLQEAVREVLAQRFQA